MKTEILKPHMRRYNFWFSTYQMSGCSTSFGVLFALGFCLFIRNSSVFLTALCGYAFGVVLALLAMVGYFLSDEETMKRHRTVANAFQTGDEQKVASETNDYRRWTLLWSPPVAPFYACYLLLKMIVKMLKMAVNKQPKDATG